ncbi:hypothetical protein GGR53DRAFT_469821 [Hypoxylon sp. FL1150]|nr:hypothetical protein GGR53DRAFT_469821 [Hypoxylon sp. FL1150]
MAVITKEHFMQSAEKLEEEVKVEETAKVKTQDNTEEIVGGIAEEAKEVKTEEKTETKAKEEAGDTDMKEAKEETGDTYMEEEKHRGSPEKKCPPRDFINEVGRFDIIKIGKKNAFIHIPLLDLGRYKYAPSGKAKATLRNFMQLSIQFVALAADTAMKVLENPHHHDNPHSLEACEEVSLALREKLESVEGMRFKDDLAYAHKQLVCLELGEPFILAS